MKAFKKILIFVSTLFIFTFSLTYACFRLVFYVGKKKADSKEYPIPPGTIYEPYHDIMIRWMNNFRTMPHEEFRIKSFDGLTLYGNYYEYKKGAPIELMFHGYRGTAERDLSVGIQRCFSMGRNALIVDQRTSGRSEGHVITFGVKEHRDCLSWIDFAMEHFGSDVQLVLTGISMGASTVLMAGMHELPKNVYYILADCGFSSAKSIIKKCAKQIHLPANFLYPFIKLGARIFGHFDLEEITPEEAVKHCKIPVVLIHGTDDSFVPAQMSQINYDACSAPKKLVNIPNAGHGIAYLLDPKTYIDALVEISEKAGLETKVTFIEL